MKSPDIDADTRLWNIVTATVRPLSGRRKERPSAASVSASGSPPIARAGAALPGATLKNAPLKTGKPPARQIPARGPRDLHAIEPGRRRRLDRGRDQPAASVDLHGLNQDQARAALTGFILRGWAENRRTILVITGKGALGDGVLRRRVPEWLAEPPLRKIVAGLSEAHRRHGGEGALYVALKRAEPR